MNFSDTVIYIYIPDILMIQYIQCTCIYLRLELKIFELKGELDYIGSSFICT